MDLATLASQSDGGVTPEHGADIPTVFVNNMAGFVAGPLDKQTSMTLYLSA